MAGRTLIAAVCVVACSCAGAEAEQPPVAPGPVRLLFAGDVMMGRGVAPVLEADGPAVLEGARFAIGDADLALANLESALAIDAPDEVADRALVGSPDAASVLAAAGFDLLNLANNHTADAGQGSVRQTAAFLEAVGIRPIGLSGVAFESRNGIRIAFLAYDLTHSAAAGEVTHGWDPEQAEEAVAGARSAADIVVVSLHGGVEYLPSPDPALRHAVEAVAAAGADVVWVHGAHVTYPVELITSGGRPTLAAYGLGNFLFDQRQAGTTEGLVVEVLVDGSGIVAYRIGRVEHRDLRVRFVGWELPEGDAVLLGGEWWELTRSVETTLRTAHPPISWPYEGVVEAVDVGDVTGDGRLETVVAFRRPYRERPVNTRFPDVAWIDEDGNTAHLGVYRPEDLSPLWVASGIPHAIDGLAVCDGSLAVRYSEGAGSGAWTWHEFGFAVAPDLTGMALPGCADIDGDGHLDPVARRGM